MLRKRIKYVDYDDLQREEDFYFNLTESELIEWEASEKGGMDKLVKRIIDEEDQTRLIPLFKEMILKSYGIKSPDGKRFEKSPEISKAFVECPAYNVLFLELTHNAQAAANFVNGIVPKKLDSAVAQN